MRTKKRFDLQIIASWIEPESTVLDLGCGEGELLFYLKTHKQVTGTGIEQDEAKVSQSIEKGLSVLQGDINEDVFDYPDGAFDYVILSQTLQQVYEPEELIQSLLRIGKRGIVSFPNFSHWSVRLQLLITGYAPKTKEDAIQEIIQFLTNIHNNVFLSKEIQNGTAQKYLRDTIKTTMEQRDANYKYYYEKV